MGQGVGAGDPESIPHLGGHHLGMNHQIPRVVEGGVRVDGRFRTLIR